MGPRLNGVIDSSAFVNLLVGRVAGDDVALFDGEFSAPDVFMIETASGLRRTELRGLLSDAEAIRLFGEMLGTPIELVPSRELVERAFEMRHSLTIADGCYVALAEQLECGLLTADRRLARAPDINVPVTVV
ncbi:MAG: type II toxin-antitoxin system VapC family toxin [Acidimicrobiia bacterium]